jgi:hypothetical protein
MVLSWQHTYFNYRTRALLTQRLYMKMEDGTCMGGSHHSCRSTEVFMRLKCEMT